MNKRPIEQAQDPDLRLSFAALRRAAARARELARTTGTRIVVSRDGVVELLDPDSPELDPSTMQEPAASYGDKR